jgi:cytochrome P450
MAALVPPRVAPASKPLGRLAFVTRFVRNPLEVIPQAAYEEDFVPVGGRVRRAWITSPALVKGVLLDERDKFRKLTQIRLLGPLLGRGILTSEGAEWKWQRQAASPMFRPQELASFVPALVRAAQARVEKWRAAPPGTVQPIDEEMTRATFDVIAATLLPTVDARLPPAIRESMRTLQRTGAWDLLFASMNLPHWLPHPGMLSEMRAMKRLRASVAQVIRESKSGGAAIQSLTRRLVEAQDPESGQSMDEERLVDNVLTFYLAGHETTAKALTWTLYLLSRSPEWAAAIRDEVEQVTGGAAVAAEHVDRLAVTQQVVKEAMRLYSPVPIMSRQAIAAARIDGRDIAAGTSVLLPIYAIHRHRARWEEPDAFRPERFSPASEAALPRYQYMPFGAGPRVCIGRAFAMLEAAAMLATFVRHASFAPAGGPEPVPVARVTLLPRDGMPLRVTVDG